MAKGFARTFGQDLMRGEHIVGGGMPEGEKRPRGRPRKANGEIAGGGGGAFAAHNERAAANRARAIQTQGWVQDKIADGDIEGGMSSGQTGTSIFDPVLCELAYRWFSPMGGMVLDPFAGGSVRGIVASKLGRRYVGIDLRREQIVANEIQGRKICGEPMPRWIAGDSVDIPTLAAGVEADFVFSCPPYADLEVYSDDPLDLSTMSYERFASYYRIIIKRACELLKPDRFACFVVGEARGADGAYYGFVPDTIKAFQDAGLAFYNEAILVTAAGSLPIRAGKQFSTTRKLGKTHQQMLVFLKGDAKRATEACGVVDVEEGLFAAVSAEGAEAGGEFDQDPFK